MTSFKKQVIAGLVVAGVIYMVKQTANKEPLLPKKPRTADDYRHLYEAENGR